MNTQEKNVRDNNTILIVEDSKLQAETLTETLKRKGYAVMAVRDGLEGLSALMESKPDLIISDIWMPNMDGYEFCRTVKDDAKLRHIPVILLTKLSDTEDIIKGLAAGADCYLTKPYNENLLFSIVDSIFSGSKAHTGDNGNNIFEMQIKGRALKLAITPQQIMNFLFSTYENLLYQNQNLIQVKDELKALNDHLEERIKEKTHSLELEAMVRRKAQEAHMESAAKYHAVMKEAADAIVLTDTGWNIIEVNKKAEKLLGYSKEEFTNMNIARIYPERDIEKVIDTFQIIMHTGTGSLNDVELVRKDGSSVSVDMTWNTVEYTGNKIIQGILRDITNKKEAEKALKQSNEMLQKVLSGTVAALATAAEMRDPYTAGHQLRVSKLACAIARELGLSEEETAGIQVMGFLHDIGKIIVPAEILTKPSKLTEYEFRFIMVHAQAGFDILKGIEFPWPVATAVLQHHERLNGSGYPSGLSGDQIILEAKILSVADVIESMASHRPYRPALGIEKAIEEISTNRGILYDPGVAEVSIRLFRERGFRFEN